MNAAKIFDLIAAQLIKRYGDKSLNELIGLAVAVYENIMDLLADANSRAVVPLPDVDDAVTKAVFQALLNEPQTD